MIFSGQFLIAWDSIALVSMAQKGSVKGHFLVLWHSPISIFQKPLTNGKVRVSRRPPRIGG